MANKDLVRFLYDGSIKIDYKDKTHRYYAYPRINWDLAPEDSKAWGSVLYPKGTTTLIGDTLEKKGLMTWPMGLALRELFGFYDFKNENGEQMTGYSKGVGTFWDPRPFIAKSDDMDGVIEQTKQECLPLILSASKAWQRKQKKGADIGTVVHSAIEAFITNEPFDIATEYMWSIKEAITDVESPEYQLAMEEFENDVAQAAAAFNQFIAWWNEKEPKLLGAEEIVYSKEHNIAGLYDGLIELDGKTILCDWKSSSASKSKEACAPNGVYYSYFIQSAIYAMAWQEMGKGLVDDLMIVSCRKDGEFDIVTASQLGLSVEKCIDWAKAVITCYKFMDQTKSALWQLGEETGRVNNKKEK